MSYVREREPETLYHLTEKSNLASILADGRIRRFGDRECWFCRSIPDMLRYMEYTVLQEGKPYYAVDGSLKRYPKFDPDKYVLLKLEPKYSSDKWFRWEQELPPNASAESITQAREFSSLKVGYRGDLRFKNCECINISELMNQDSEQALEPEETAEPRMTM